MMGCLTCSNYNQCNSCFNGYVLVTSSTFKTCSCLSNYFVNGSCIICNVYFGYGCLACNNACHSCINNYRMNATTLANDFYNPCKPCSYFFDFCETCNSSVCISCKSTFNLENSSCICPANNIIFNLTCLNCN